MRWLSPKRRKVNKVYARRTLYGAGLFYQNGVPYQQQDQQFSVHPDTTSSQSGSRLFFSSHPPRTSVQIAHHGTHYVHQEISQWRYAKIPHKHESETV